MPLWKPIGEAANDFSMFIEQIDGYRVPVQRHVKNALDQSELIDMENQNRVQRDIHLFTGRMRLEALRLGEAMGKAEESARLGLTAESEHLRRVADERQKDFERSNARAQERIYPYDPFGSPYNW